MTRTSHMARARSTKLCILFILLSCISTIIVQLCILTIQPATKLPDDATIDISKTKISSAHPLLPTCHPHWKVAISNISSNGGPIDNQLSWSNTLPITRIYFYHFRKAGGTMIRNYLEKVAVHYDIDLEMKEYNHASKEEEVGSRNDTIYITNMRDPVSRSISHFKYNGRWDCQQLVKNESLFIATESNAQPFKAWNQTSGFEPSPCDMPFSFTSCAVNCYIQTFSGKGCTSDDWFTEYNLAQNRLLRYNMILVYEKFNDPNYITAVETFFGIQGFNNEPSFMFCGREAKKANRRVPLTVKFEYVLLLTKLNEMDNRLYKDLVTSCWEDGEEGDGEYLFPKVDTSRFLARIDRRVID
mmetsp:Transcript_34403/g.61774  ORF Transcript_34403/g.61774 Transcript_34403/m.61774 type:complete len:357 (+) Transcript_34403:148-1218(+)|eukprot:CAMPEP_0201901366 /NCGR_PEP_ID=MMETSP0902-20130614/54144_1 /ASSEMBLY_ACC=CAM_ASM_000551 /TAXON_ID=420261 /ORGANISM="Thalassiosira antarctica, Strain CCMP982" /LENGTH=356 /DNA_ID=CAMNT_0048435279 /DNA_START=28 /DNA_END=1098 /DNA_ORIENTATION=-